MWATQPVPGAKAVLKEKGNYYTLPVLMEAVAGADGRFVIENPPVGTFSIYAVAPSAEYNAWRGWDVTIQAGQAVDVGIFYLAKVMQLLEPPQGGSVSTTTPVLRWASFPGAAKYHVDVFNNATGEAVMRQDTTNTSITVSPPLTAGVTYQWSASCFDAAGNDLAYYSAWTFTVQ